MKRHPWLAAVGAVGGVALALSARGRFRPHPFRGQVVVITGGSRGLGLAMAARFGEAGARLVLAARNGDELKKARQGLVQGGSVSSVDDVHLITCDLSREGEAQRLIEEATTHFGRVDVLVNNASLIYIGPLELQPLESYQKAMQITYFAMVEASKAVLPQMEARHSGSIVNITSIGGKLPVPHLSPYVGAKFAAVGFSDTMGAEVAPKGVRVTTVYPGLMRTGSFPNAIAVGRLEDEYRWFSTAAVLPGISHSADSAAAKIVAATTAGARQVSIGPETFVAAKIYGLLPAFTQMVGSLAKILILPPSEGTSTPTPGKDIKPPDLPGFAKLAQAATASHNQPAR